MSETNETPEAPPAWRWQGFFGGMAAVANWKETVDAMPGEDIGVVIPERGMTPRKVDTEGVMGMFAVQVRPTNPLPIPQGMREADEPIVGRLVGA